ncbi:hypothetical protein [Cupriavidus pauculus]|uniref:hypothetical protein n=1 Tax=Cupriavidus pauculus TaxID=82633 RepID=UPI001EE2DC70|nr:hypothetical protein [Cupriavidus pauculus]GJG98396.1 hypothetical protein CBA19C6_27925 [Cupriavidus pauculus]
MRKPTQACRRTLAALIAAAAVCAAPASAADRKIALVTQAGGPSAVVDQRVKAHLESRGYRVELFNQDIAPDAVADVDCVILSSTISAKSMKGGWRQLAVPIVTWENDYLDDLAMTGKRHDTDFGEAARKRYVWLVNAPHPAAAGLAPGVVNVYQKQAGMSWGKPGLGASTIATLYGQPDKAAVFTYERGATMDYESIAPARRVMFFLGNETFTNLSAEGMRLFDATVDWAAQPARK